MTDTWFDETIGQPVNVSQSKPMPVQIASSGGSVFALLTNASTTGDPVTVGGGTYIWDAVGTFGGTTLTLQYLAADGVTYENVANGSMTSPGSLKVAIGANTTIKCVVTGGSPSGLYSNLSFVS